MKRRHFIAGTLGSAAALTLAACSGNTEPGGGGGGATTVPSKPAEPERPRIRLVAGGRFGQAFVAANENGPGQGPGPSAA